MAQDCVNCPRYNSVWDWFRIALPEWPLELIEVEKVDYQRNGHASFCKRPEDMVDTIVLHHTETPSTNTPEDINRYHLNRGSANDPWYMIAYTYVISSPYPGNSNPEPKVSEGRPLEIVGAHAGSNAFIPMDAHQTRLWNEGKIVCGKEGGRFSVDRSLVQNGRIKANVTTVGMVVIGNYVPFSRNNPNGYPRNRVRNPSSQTQDMIARMACQLQKKYPRMKNIKWHSQYNSTDCPGTVKNFVTQIKNMAKGYGCEFY